MKIVVCPSDQTGCGKYRLIWPAEALQAKGLNISIQRRPKILVKGDDVLDVILPPNTDVIVFQRPASHQITQLIPILHKYGIKVVIDMDDDLETINKKNIAYKVYNGEDSLRSWKWAKKACGMADVVTATTEALLDKYANNNGVLIPNCIPERFLDVTKTQNELVTVGWAGFVGNHPDDLQTTHGAINEAIAKQPARFMGIGEKRMFDILGVRHREPNVFVPGTQFDEYPNAVAKLDIGIVPLANTFFNECKSWLKSLEYASLGVAPVVSPTPDNMRMVNLGGAYVARNPKEWRDTVRQLIVNDQERKELVTRARQVAADWTVEKNAYRWIEAWTQS